MSLLDGRMRKLEGEVGVDIISGGKELGKDGRSSKGGGGHNEIGMKGGERGAVAGGKPTKDEPGRGHQLARATDAGASSSEIDWGEIEDLLGSFGPAKAAAPGQELAPAQGLKKGPGLASGQGPAKRRGLDPEGRPPLRPRTAPAALVARSSSSCSSEQKQGSGERTIEGAVNKEGRSKQGGEGRDQDGVGHGSNPSGGVLFIDGKPDERYLFPPPAVQAQGLGRNSPPKVVPKVNILLLLFLSVLLLFSLFLLRGIT